MFAAILRHIWNGHKFFAFLEYSGPSWSASSSTWLVSGLTRLSPKQMGHREWDNHLSIMTVVQDDNPPRFRVLMADAKHYFVNQLSRMHISIIQGSNLLSAVVWDMGILGRQIKIEARHQILHHTHWPTFMRV
jgi:hypothetical protein